MSPTDCVMLLKSLIVLKFTATLRYSLLLQTCLHTDPFYFYTLYILLLYFYWS